MNPNSSTLCCEELAQKCEGVWLHWGFFLLSHAVPASRSADQQPLCPLSYSFDIFFLQATSTVWVSETTLECTAPPMADGGAAVVSRAVTLTANGVDFSTVAVAFVYEPDLGVLAASPPFGLDPIAWLSPS